MSRIEPTYELISDSPPPTEWETYSNHTTAAFQTLISNTPAESEVQDFLEQNPSMLPGAWTPGSTSGHGPFLHAAVSQPQLSGSFHRKPDFLWIATHSIEWFPTLIEIEQPDKRVFRSAGQNRSAVLSEFAQARHQLVEWRTWFREPANQQAFISRFGISSLITQRQMTLHMILIYGRRDEYVDDPQRTKVRANLLDPGEELISYERLQPMRANQNMITVRCLGGGRFRCVAVPPTYRIGPNNADDLLFIDGMEAIIRGDERYTTERRQFLIERIPYWRDWAGSELSQSGIGPNAWE